jgi:hypothetical protein
MRSLINRTTASACAAAVLALAAAGGAAILRPGVASATAGPDTSFPCHSSSPCVTAVNSGTGPGVKGSGKTGAGVLGTSTNGFAVEGDSGNGATGGVKGVGTSGFGLFGQSSTGAGIYGQSTLSYGVEAISGSNDALHAVSTDGNAISASTTNGYAIYASTSNGTALSVSSANGVGADFSGATSGIVIHSPSSSAYPLVVHSLGDYIALLVNGNGNVSVSPNSGTALTLEEPFGDGLFTYASGNGAVIEGADGVVARAPTGTGTFPIIAQDFSNNDVFYVDGNGDVFYHGSLNQFARTRGGQHAMAFGSNATTPSLEDVGSAQLVNGQALVPLDPTFAQAIDLRTPYHVFLTPDGDTRGLYVASKGRDAFVVRETQNGRGTLAFDYRIVATALGHAGERMTLVSPSQEPKVRVVRPHAIPTPRAHLVRPRTKNSAQ